MPEDDRRLRRAAVTRHTQQVPADLQRPQERPAADQPSEQGDEEAGQRHDQRALWLDAQVRNAMSRGDFDDLPGAGKPIPGLDKPHDPDWWVKRLIEREQISVAPPAFALRKEDAQLEAALDEQTAESEVRRLLADFNRRVVEARRQLQGGPPVVTPTRDVDAEVTAWRARREARRAAAAATAAHAVPPRERRGWFRRRRR